MKDLVRIFKSPEGDVYHISLSEDKGVLSQEVMETLGNVHVVGIELRRLAGRWLFVVLSSFRKEAKGYVHFLGARKRNQKNIHLTKPSLYGRM